VQSVTPARLNAAWPKPLYDKNLSWAYNISFWLTTFMFSFPIHLKGFLWNQSLLSLCWTSNSRSTLYESPTLAAPISWLTNWQGCNPPFIAGFIPIMKFYPPLNSCTLVLLFLETWVCSVSCPSMMVLSVHH